MKKIAQLALTGISSREKMRNTYKMMVEKSKRKGSLEKPLLTFDDTEIARKERGRQGSFFWLQKRTVSDNCKNANEQSGYIHTGEEFLDYMRDY